MKRILYILDDNAKGGLLAFEVDEEQYTALEGILVRHAKNSRAAVGDESASRVMDKRKPAWKMDAEVSVGFSYQPIHCVCRHDAVADCDCCYD